MPFRRPEPLAAAAMATAWIAAFAPWSGSVWAQPRLTDAQANAIDALFAPWDRLDSPGCTAAASRDGALLFEGAWGMANLELDVPLRTDSVFYAGSVSKQFTAAAVTLLALRGQIDLDADVRRSLTWLQIEQPFTARQLLHHTSGVRDYFELLAMTGASDRAFIGRDEVFDLLAMQRELNFLPGSAYAYSNGGYWLLSELVQVASGRTLAEFARDEFFDPLEMERSHFEDDHRQIVPGRAASYGVNGDGELFRYVKAFDAVGSGGVLTTAADLLAWAHEFDSPRVLPPRLVEQMQVRGKLTDGSDIAYASGLTHGEYRGAATVAHGGSLLGFRTQLTRVPHYGVAVAVLCNMATLRPGTLAEGILDVLLGDVLEAPAAPAAPAAPPAAAAPSPPADPQLYAGSYWSDELEVLYRIDEAGGELRLSIHDRTRGTLVHVGENAFDGPTGTLRFRRSDDGTVLGFVLGSDRVRGVSFRKRIE